MKLSNCGLLSVGAIVALSLVGPAQVLASTAFYVSPTGNDASPGTIAAPFKTLGKAASKTLAGDAIVLLAASYTGQWTLTDQSIPEPTWVMPPRYPVQKIPPHVSGWVDALFVSPPL